MTQKKIIAHRTTSNIQALLPPLLYMSAEVPGSRLLQTVTDTKILALSPYKPFLTDILFGNDLDTNQWRIGTDSWIENLCRMESDNVVVNHDILTLQLQNDPIPGNPILYSGGEVQSTQTYNSGAFSFWIQNGAKSGTVGSAFLISQPTDNWHQQEIDIEFLGNNPNGVQFNLHSIQHLADGSKIDETNNQFKVFIDLGFDTRAGVHQYTIDWNPDKKYIAFMVDGVERYRITDSKFIPNTPLELRLNHWAPNNPSWVGTLDPNDPNSFMQYQKIEINQNVLSSKLDVIIPAEIISSAFTAVCAFASGYLSEPIRKYIVQPIYNGLLKLFSPKGSRPFKQTLPSIPLRTIAVTGTISGCILGATKGAMLALSLGPAGIAVGGILGAIAGSICGGLGSYLGAKVYQLTQIQKHK